MVILILIVIILLSVLSTGRVSSLESKIAQMLVMGFLGDDESNPEFAASLEKYNPGGVILYNRPSYPEAGNIKSPAQLLRLTNCIKQHSKIPPFIAVDQEGGKVIRLKPEHGFQASASAREIGEQNLVSVTSNWAGNIAKELQENGINLNLAPVIDLDINPDSPAIGRHQRCFSSLPELVTIQARIFCQMMNNYKIYNCLKHFPGHGSASTDSHYDKADVSQSWNDLELEPYQQLIPENIADMVMVSHIQNKHLDENYPASLSKNIITSLLRDRLNWQGVIITDDLQMKAVADQYSLTEILRLAILAGNDLLLFGNSKPNNQLTIEQIVETTRELVYSGEIPESLIERSYQGIRRLKAKFIDI